MSATVDGYKLFQVIDGNDIAHEIAAVNRTELDAQIHKQKIQNIKRVGWHPWYREYVVTENEKNRRELSTKIEDAIWNNIVSQ